MGYSGLLGRVQELRRTPVKSLVDSRLRQFRSFQKKADDDWFSELCFCILTANSKARTALAIESELGKEGFLTCDLGALRSCIRRNKHRFHNNKSKYIVEARKNRRIKSLLSSIDGSASAREWLVKNVKGIGYKEASHFLRNVGYTDVAILDRHILNLFEEHKIAKRPKALNRKSYLEIEKKFNSLARKADMSAAELDLYLWYIKTGEILK